MTPKSCAEGPIAIFDSGIGGLPYLAAARRALPGESFAYLADREGFPYGTKTREEVRALVLGIVSRLVEECSPKAIVIACNTASQAGLEAARKANPGLPIIGTVPAVKPAAERSRSGTIAILASNGAVEDPYLDSLVARYAAGLAVIREGAQELVAFVERRSASAGQQERREAVMPHIRLLVERGADEIVLACTHFLHLRDDIAAVAGSGVEVVDSIAGVVSRLKTVLAEKGLLCRSRINAVSADESTTGSRFFLTGPSQFEPEYSVHAKAFDLRCPERLLRR